MAINYRDILRSTLMDLGTENVNVSNTVPTLFHGVGEGDGNNIGSLYLDTRLLDGKHIINYRLGWVTEHGIGELALGDAVSYELAVAMFQGLLHLITNRHPTHSDIIQTISRVVI